MRDKNYLRSTKIVATVGTATAKERPSSEIEKKEVKTKKPVEVNEKSPIDSDFCKG